MFSAPVLTSAVILISADDEMSWRMLSFIRTALDQISKDAN